jgi:hypothetical protein
VPVTTKTKRSRKMPDEIKQRIDALAGQRKMLRKLGRIVKLLAEMDDAGLDEVQGWIAKHRAPEPAAEVKMSPIGDK